MLLVGIFLGLNLMSFAFGCWPSIEHDQSKFCRSQLAFTGFVLWSTETDMETIFLIQLTSNLKLGVSSSLVNHHDEHHDFDTTHLNNIANYDCSCEIKVDLPQQRPQGSTVPASDKCVITEREYDCRFRQGFCFRRRSALGGNRCRWIVPNTVCPRRLTRHAPE